MSTAASTGSVERRGRVASRRCDPPLGVKPLGVKPLGMTPPWGVKAPVRGYLKRARRDVDDVGIRVLTPPHCRRDVRVGGASVKHDSPLIASRGLCASPIGRAAHAKYDAISLIAGKYAARVEKGIFSERCVLSPARWIEHGTRQGMHAAAAAAGRQQRSIADGEQSAHTAQLARRCMSEAHSV